MSNCKYPWDAWFKRRLLRLVRGKDYHCMPHSMAQLVRETAGIRGVRVSIAIENETVTVKKRGAV